MEKIGIIVAMSSEFQLVMNLLDDKEELIMNGITFVEGQIGDKSIILAQCGIGKVCSAVGVLEMIDVFQPDCVINSGVAGGMDVSVKVMDIVVGKSMVYHDVWCGEGNEYGQIQGMPARFAADEDLYKKAMSLKNDLNIYGGLICSGDKFITDRKELDRIKHDFPEVMAVDMESCSMAQVCYMIGVPFLSFRIISDTPGVVEDHTAQYKDFWTMAPEKSFDVLRQLIAVI